MLTKYNMARLTGYAHKKLRRALEVIEKKVKKNKK